MKKALLNVLGLILGGVIGMVVNGSLVDLGHTVFPIEGLDLNNMEEVLAAIPNFEPKHFVFPFLAHALGTLVGAFIATIIARSRQLMISMIIGGLFFVGGFLMVLWTDGPMWFSILDLGLAYFPMAWLGNKLAMRSKRK